MENVNNDSAVATPATDTTTTADNTNTTTANVVEATATSEPKANETATTTTSSSASESKPKVDSGLPKGVRKELWELRETVRNLKQQIAQPNQFAQTPNTTAVEKVEKVGLLDDTDKWEQNHTREVVNIAKKEFLAELEQAKEAERIKKENEDGINYLLSKKEVADDPDAKAEIAEILQRADYAYIAQKYPAKAAKLAYDEFISSKGVSVERQNIVSANIAATSTPSSTAKPMTKKTWSRAEVEKVLSDFNNPNYANIEAEIRQAHKEGRIK